MTLPLMLGTAKVDITPREPLPLAGFGSRNGNYEGIHHRLYARIWFFKQINEEGQSHSVLLVQADLIWWGTDRMAAIKQQMLERWGLDEASFILHASHTHSGPQTSDRFFSSKGKFNSAYVLQLEESLFEGIALAESNTELVTMERGLGSCRMAVNRRKQVNGEMKMAPNFEGMMDPEVNVIRFSNDNKEVKGVLFHYACHPTTTDNNFVSSEFPGIAMEHIEQTLGDGVVASFLQGCCGDVRPALVRDGEFYKDGDKVTQLGMTLSEEVLRVLQQPMELIPPKWISGKKTEVRLPLQQLPQRSELKELSLKEGYVGKWSQYLLDHPARINANIPLEITMLTLAEGLSFLAMNGEVVVDYGLFIKSQFKGMVLPLPYSNGMIGYIPTAKQIFEGGYESKEAVYHFCLPAPFDASLEKRIRDHVSQLIDKETESNSTNT